MSHDDLSPLLTCVMPKGDAFVTQSTPFIIIYDLPDYCVVESVSVETLPSARSDLFCRFQYVSRRQSLSVTGPAV